MSCGTTVAREYLRVSKDRRKKGTSPAEQHDENLEAAEERGWTLHPTPFDDTDKGASRHSRVEREAYQAMTRAIGDGSFGAQVLMVWEASRASRRTAEWLALIDACEAQGIQIFVTTHARLYDPSVARDRKQLRDDASEAEYAADEASLRLKRSARANAKKGRPHGRNLYGYTRLYVSGPDGPELDRVVEEPFEASVVRFAARHVLAGRSPYWVAATLNEMAVPPRRKKTVLENAADGWTDAAVRQMLKSPAYAGLRQHQGKVVGSAEWPALISQEDYARLTRRRAAPPPREARHLLSGIARCGLCGGRMSSGRQNRGRDESGKMQYYSTYTCSRYLVPGRGEKHVTMKAEHLDQLVERLVIRRLQRPDFLESTRTGDGEVEDRRRDLQRRIDANKAYLDEVQERAAAIRRFDLLLDQEARIQPEIDADEAELSRLSGWDEGVVTLAEAEDIPAVWAALPITQKRMVIRELLVPIVGERTLPRGSRRPDYERVQVQWLGGLADNETDGDDAALPG